MKLKCYFFLLFLSILATGIKGQSIRDVSGIIRSEGTNEPIAGVTLQIHGRTIFYVTGEQGRFTIPQVRDSMMLHISHVQYKSKTIIINNKLDELIIHLERNDGEIQEVAVYATGYTLIPKERAAGSFEIFDKKKLNQSLSSNILDRLDGLSGSLALDRRAAMQTEGGKTDVSLRLRGMSTLMSDARPLIIVNNFPFEGKLSDINPNDIESISFLKDASASAIWGAKSANGVIVIQLKQSKIGESKSINALFTTRISNKPNLYANNRFISAPEYMGFEEIMFNRNYYRDEKTILLSPYAHLLSKKHKGLIDENEFQFEKSKFMEQDIRKQADQYLYQNAIDKIMNINMSGGSSLHSYLFSIGYDDVKPVLVGNSNSRLSLRVDNKIRITSKFEAQFSIDYIHRMERNNSVSLFDQSGIVPADKNMIYPYASLIDINGEPTRSAIAFNPFFLDSFNQSHNRDWLFSPLEELDIRDNTYKNNSIRMFSNLNYKLSKDLTISANYIFNSTNGDRINHFTADSYYTRNLVNRFMQGPGSFIIPNGAIRHKTVDASRKYGGRMQLDFNKNIFNKLSINSLVGGEISSYISIFDPLQILYNFSEDNYIGQNIFDYSKYYTVNPDGAQRIPSSNSQIYELTDRFISYYGLGTLMWDNRYLLTTSLRWDGSNLFGVKTNQKGVPLWSLASGWLLHNEKFMNNSKLSELKLRATIGENGNINKNATAYPTAVFTTNSSTGLREALLKTAGNPQLKWERVLSWNIGVDWALLKRSLGGSIDFFKKDAYDLMGLKEADPTTGINPVLSGVKQMINYGKFESSGFDVRLFSKNNIGNKLIIDTDFSISKNWNKVVDYNVVPLGIQDYFQYIVPAVAGKSRDIFYAFPWYGLDSQTGAPLIMEEGNLTTNYTNVPKFLPENLMNIGSSFPIWNGSFRAGLSYKQLSLSALILWKGKYNFRRSSINYQELLDSWNMHNDYYLRWQQPGDEDKTYIPAIPTTVDRNRELYYMNSDVLVERGDYIRLQSIQINYSLPLKNNLFKLDVIGVMENLGLIWTKNKQGLDPEYHLYYYNPPKQFSLGLRANF